MCTQPRMVVPFAFYQVTSKSICGQKIFPDNTFKTFFLKELSLSLKSYSFQCLAWSIMDDHFYMVVKSSDISVSKFMQRLNSVYAKHFNRYNKRKGHLFEQRFASVIIQEDKGLDSAVSFVHLNPVRLNGCTLDELDQYEWSGHKALANRLTDGIVDIEAVYSLFKCSDPVKKYCEFVKSEQADSKNQEIVAKIRTANRGCTSSRKAESWVIGDEDFVRRTLEQSKSIRVLRHIRENMTADQVLSIVSDAIHLDKEEILKQGRLNDISTARQLFAVAGTLYFEFTNICLARILGVSGSAVSKMVSRSKRIVGLELLKEMVCAA